MQESSIEKKACGYAADLGMLPIKIVAGGVRGRPDRLFLVNGSTYFFIEFKRPGESPTKLQWYWLNILQNLGIHAYWTDNLEEAKDIIYGYRTHTTTD
jgi:hypothetical protein